MVKRILDATISFYQKYIRNLIPSCCRFYPSCSEYARLAIAKYGALRGSVKALVRIVTCHPFSGKSGFDYP